MHPQVREKKPGSCPYCGMALEATIGSAKNPELVSFQIRFWVCLVLTAPILFVPPALQFVLATPVILWGGFPLFRKGIFTRQINMFSLITLGVITAYLFSIWAYFNQQDLYFEVAAVITTLVILGQFLELKAREKTGGVIRALMELAPPTAALESGEIIPLENVKKGDRLRVKPGEKIPVDGVILSGDGAVDESMMSGESVPVDKKTGDKVIGGSINLSGSFIYKAEAVGEDTVLSRIIQQVAEAQMSRAPIQKLADWVSQWFVPIVVVIAILTLLGWGFQASWGEGVINAVAVLIIACPCALGLATPLSIRVGVGLGALQGILFKDATAIEKLASIQTLLIDKTGTLTEGKISLERVIPLVSTSEPKLLQLAASLEIGSEHPLGKAIVAKNSLPILPVENFKTVAGIGVYGKVDNHNLRIEKSPDLSDAMRLRDEGKTVLCLFIDETPSALFAFFDPIKNTTQEALVRLEKLGIDLVMVTGDHAITAKTVARNLKLDRFEAEVLPEMKLELLKKYQHSHKKVAMAGDGINDAPALAAADVGIAMGTGTDVAIATSDITLIKGDLRGIATAILLSQKTVWNIRENLVFAFLYNVLAVPLASLGFLSPFIGSLAMTLSSLSVVLNSLRLHRTFKKNLRLPD